MVKFKLGFLFLFMVIFTGAVFAENTAFHKILRERRTIRHFQQKEIPRAVLKICLEDAVLAPCAGNRQKWQFILVEKPQLREQVFQNVSWLAQDQPAKNETPMAYVFFLAPAEGQELFVDLAFAAGNFINAAWAEGIGCCLIGSFNRDELKNILKIPPKTAIFLVAACGYPEPGKIPQKSIYKNRTEPYWEGTVLKVPKKSLDSVLFFNYFGTR